MVDMESVNEEQSWLWDNLLVIILNLIFGAVTCVLIWVCTRTPEKEEPPKEPSKDKHPCKEPISEAYVKVTTDEVEEDCTFEEVAHVESVDDDDFLRKLDEATTEISTKDLIEDITVEEVEDLKDANEDLYHHQDEDATMEVSSELKVEASSDSSADDYVVVKEIVTREITVDPVELITVPMTTYEIHVKTGNVSGAGTDANVFIIVYGEQCDTGKIHLKTSKTHQHKFERDHVDSFTEEAVNVGKISKIRIGHDNKGGFAGWYLDNVVIDVPIMNCKWTFPADRWLDKKEDDKKLEVDIYPTLVEETYVETVYEEVKLEDATIKDGNENVTSDTIVSHTHKDPETDGSKTTVSFTTDTKILRSAGGSGNEMVVEEVTVTTSEEVHTTTFNVKTDEDTHVHISAPDVAVESITNNDKFIIESADSCVSAELVDDVKEDGTEFNLHAYSNDAVCMEKTDEISGVRRFEVLMPDVEPEEITEGENVTYNIDVKTGDVSGAGTNANVFITIYGTKKDTGKIDLKKSTTHKNEFERNHLDSFTVEAIDVGRIGKVRIGHDNKGGFAGWYLDYVVICIPHTNHKETFTANRWLDKKEDDRKLEVDLYPLSSYEDSHHEETPEIVPTEIDLGELESAMEDYVNKLPTHEDKDSEEITESKDDEDRITVPTEEVTISKRQVSFEDEITTVGEVVEVESAPTDHMDEFNEEVEEVKVPTGEVTITNGQISCEDEMITFEEVLKVESAPVNHIDLLNEDLEEFKVPTGEVAITNGQISCEDEMITFEEVLEVESAPVDHIDLLNEDVEEVKEGSLDDQDALLRVNADILVNSVIETVKNSSLKLEFKVVGYSEEVDDNWRLACIDDVNHSTQNVKHALEGKTWDMCALVDGSIGGAGFNYELKTEINDVYESKLLVKGTKVGDTGTLLDADKDIHFTIVQEGSLDDTGDLLGPHTDIAVVEDSLDDTGDLLGAATDIPVIEHTETEIVKVKKDKKKKKERSSASSSSEDIEDEDVMKLFKKFDTDGDGRISVEEFMGRMKKDKKKRKKEKKRLKKEKNAAAAAAADDPHSVSKESDIVPTHDLVIEDKETCYDPFHKFHGQFECHVYDGTETKNDWHYVVITYNSQLVEFTWSNAAGVKWKLYPYTEDTLRVGEDCPYYNDGHIFAKFTEDGVYGPWNELYQRIGSVLRSVTSSLPDVELQVVDYHYTIDDQWRMATINDVEVNMENVKNVLTNKTWHICALVDGNIGGPGYNYGIRHEVKELPHKLIIKADVTTYDIDVKTGDHSGAGTDANVFIILFGDKLCTGKIDLKKSKTHKEKFERNHVDSFTVDDVDVGKILKIRIGHDNKGGFAGWHLENVVISNPAIDGKLTFLADRWLDSKEDDKKLEVELYPVKEIDTADATSPEISKEEEDAAIKIQSLVRGAKARKEVEALKASNAPPPPDATSPEISKEEEDAAIKIQSLMRGAKARKEVEALRASSSAPAPPAEVEITIDSIADLHDEDESFLIKLETADNDVNVCDEQPQKKEEYDTSPEISKEEEDAAIKIQSLIRGKKARKELEALKASSAPSLSIQTVEIRIDDEPCTARAEIITVEELDDLESDKHVTFTEDLAEMTSYEIDVKTGDVSNAGTDANVFLVIFGEKGDTGKIVLETPKNLKQKTFERNCEDTFIVEAADVGKLTNLRIGHDNKGGFSGWYLEKVVIHIPVKNCKLTFQADRWIDKNEGDGKLEVDIAPCKEEECDVMCEMFQKDVGKEDNTDVIIDTNAGEGPAESKVEFHVDSDSPLVAENVLHQQSDNVDITDVKDEKCYDVEVKEIKVEKMMYFIDVKTGDIKFAGTDANVFIILYGDNCNTTKIDLKKSKTHKSSFERNQVDTFEVETLNVGNLEKVRIGHDNHGGFAGWYIDEVVVHAPSSGSKWTFPANRWLDKHKDDEKLEVDLYLSTKNN